MRVLNTNFSLVGVIDRVDVCENNDIIIDYKTSSSTKGSCDELFYGEKVQIFVYAKALQNLLNLQPQGVFYMPILNKFEEEKNPTARLYTRRCSNILDTKKVPRSEYSSDLYLFLISMSLKLIT